MPSTSRLCGRRWTPGAFDQDDTSDAEFEFGLTRILDGVEVPIKGQGCPEVEGCLLGSVP